MVFSFRRRSSSQKSDTEKDNRRSNDSPSEREHKVSEKDALQEEIAVLQAKLKKLQNPKLNDKQYVAQATQREVWNRNKGAKLKKPVQLKPRRFVKKHGDKVSGLVWSKDSIHIASVALDNTLQIVNALTSKRVLKCDLDFAPSCVVYSPNDDSVLVGAHDAAITVFKLSAPKSPTVISSFHKEGMTALQFVDNSELLTASEDDTCALFDVERDKVVSRFRGHEADVTDIAARGWGSNSFFFLSTSLDKTTKLWDFRVSRRPMFSFEVHDDEVYSVKLFPEDNAFLTASADGTIRLFDTRAMRPLQKYSLPVDTDLEIMTKHGSKTFIQPTHLTECKDKEVNILQQPSFSSVAASMSGRFVFSGAFDGKIHAWDALTGEWLQSLGFHNDRINQLHTSPDGKAICSGSFDHGVIVWA